MIDNMGGEIQEDETTTVAEVLKMKQILDQSSTDESVFSESLTKLQHMVKSVNVLKATGVGISVNALRNHPSKHVAMTSRTLVKEWKCMVNEWMKDCEKQKGGKSETNPKNAVPTDGNRKAIKRTRNQPERITGCAKKVEPTGPVTPEQRFENDKDDCVARVLRIKGILDDESVSKSVVLESLMKLLEIRLPVKTLQDTGIGRSVKVLQKHGSKDVRQIAWALVKQWEGMVDEYIKKGSSLNTERKIEWVDNSKVSKNRMKVGNEEKFEATKRKFREAYEEVEKTKKKRRIQSFMNSPAKSLGLKLSNTRGKLEGDRSGG